MGVYLVLQSLFMRCQCEELGGKFCFFVSSASSIPSLVQLSCRRIKVRGGVEVFLIFLSSFSFSSSSSSSVFPPSLAAIKFLSWPFLCFALLRFHFRQSPPLLWHFSNCSSYGTSCFSQRFSAYFPSQPFLLSVSLFLLFFPFPTSFMFSFSLPPVPSAPPLFPLL
eukprot:GHVT01101333.1.p1 GENE.GHVT01101333.1~~GHVT01101333.1.p1  ORF type:complete len:166 (+),score=33.56 GHVT01101333.1:253-750(+)